MFGNPVLTASGTFGFGYEFKAFFDINILGGIVMKGLSLKPKYGNPQPRIAEVPCGMINSIGLENPGVDAFIKDIYPKIKNITAPLIANVLGETTEEVLEVMRDLRDLDVDILTIGQYLQPSKEHTPISRYYTPEEFDMFRERGYAMGFRWIESNPLVRSSYNAEAQAQALSSP